MLRHTGSATSSLASLARTDSREELRVATTRPSTAALLARSPSHTAPLASVSLPARGGGGGGGGDPRRPLLRNLRVFALGAAVLLLALAYRVSTLDARALGAIDGASGEPPREAGVGGPYALGPPRAEQQKRAVAQLATAARGPALAADAAPPASATAPPRAIVVQHGGAVAAVRPASDSPAVSPSAPPRAVAGAGGEGACDAGSLAAAAAALRAWTRRARHVAAPWYGRVLHLPQLRALHACAHNTRAPSTPHDFLVLVRVAAARAATAAEVRRTWVARARAAGARVVFYSDEAFSIDDGAEQVTQVVVASTAAAGGRAAGAPVVVAAGDSAAAAAAAAAAASPRQLQGAGNGSAAATEGEAARRQLGNGSTTSDARRLGEAAAVAALAWAERGGEAVVDDALFAALQWARGAHGDARWVLAVTDATWVNLDEAVASMRFLEARLPLLVSHVHAGRMEPRFNDLRTFPALLGGVFLTQPTVAALLAGGRDAAAARGCLRDARVRAPLAVPSAALLGAYWPAPGGGGSEGEPPPPPFDPPGVLSAAELEAHRARVDVLELPLDASQVLGRCAWLLALPQLHSYLQWDGWDGSTARSRWMDRNRVPLEAVVSVAQLHHITARRGGRNATAKGGDNMSSVFAATGDKYAPLGVWSPDAHEWRVIKKMPVVAPWAPVLPRPGSEAWAAHASCPPEGVADATDALREWASHAHHPTARLYGKPLHLSQLAALHPCATNTGDPSEPAHFVLVVMASSGRNGDRLAAIHDSWVPTARAAGATVLVFTESPNATLGTIVLGDGGAGDGSYAAAQNRSLNGLKYAVAAHPAARWYWLVDDDTWVNVDVAAEVMRYVEWRVPAVYGHVLHGNMRWTDRWVTYISGGAGILLPRPAAVDLAAALFSAECPGAGLNDITLGRCAWLRRIPPVHINHMQPELDTAAMDDWRGLASTAELGALASMHRVFPAYMHAWIHRDLAAHKHASLRADNFSWRFPTLLP